MKQYLRKMDWMIVGDSLWERLQTVFPSAVRVKWWWSERGVMHSDIEVCTACKRKKTARAPSARTQASSASVATFEKDDQDFASPHSASRRRANYEDRGSDEWDGDDRVVTRRAETGKSDDSHIVHISLKKKTPSLRVVIHVPGEKAFPRGFALYSSIANHSFDSATYLSSLSPAEHRNAILQSATLHSLLTRSFP